MADIQNWLRMVQNTRSRHCTSNLKQLLDDAHCTDKPIQTRTDTDHARARPKNRLASYLGAGRTSLSMEKLDVPAAAWTSTNEKDIVYNPDIDFMCNTVLKRMLTFPSQDVPAEYNGFLLHILEAYRRLQSDKKTLQRSLDAEMESHQADLENFRLTSAAWEIERKGFLMNSSVSDPKISGTRGLGMPANIWLKRVEDASGLHSVFGQSAAEKADDVFKEPHISSTSPARRPWRRNLPPSPSRNMARLSRKLLARDTGSVEPLLSLLESDAITAGAREGNGIHSADKEDLQRLEHIDCEQSNSDISSHGGDLLPDEEYTTDCGAKIMKFAEDQDMAIHLTNWLARRIGGEPEALFPAIAELFIGSAVLESDTDSNGGQEVVNKPLLSLPQRLDPIVARIQSTLNIKRHNLDKNFPPISVANLDNRQHRGFSFTLGDDSQINHNASASRLSSTENLKADEASLLSSALFHDKHDDINGPAAISLTDEYLQAAEVPRRESYAGFVRSDNSPHREDSNRSVLTVIRDRPSYSSSTQQEGYSESFDGTKKPEKSAPTRSPRKARRTVPSRLPRLGLQAT